jgi:hypothetical protein
MNRKPSKLYTNESHNGFFSNKDVDNFINEGSGGIDMPSEYKNRPLDFLEDFFDSNCPNSLPVKRS